VCNLFLADCEDNTMDVYIGDINLRRNWNLSEKTRRGNWERQRKWLKKHRGFDYKATHPNLGPGQGQQGHYAIRGLVDDSGTVTFIGAVRDDLSLSAITGRKGKEIDLVGHTIGYREFALVRGYTNLFKPRDNQAPPRRKNLPPRKILGKWIKDGGNLLGFYSYF
jgi:hypothetical protein